MQTIMTIEPGGIVSDIAETKLRNYQHIEVVNLRQNKFGKWETIKGAKAITNGIPQIGSFIEITEEQSGERFILLDGKGNLYRIDYDVNNGYFISNNPQDIDLPNGISYQSNLIFNRFLNQIRITGFSEPLIYEYIKRNLFEFSYQDNGDFYPLYINGWELNKVELPYNPNNVGINFSINKNISKETVDSRKVYIAVSLIYDEQFSAPYFILSDIINKAAFKISLTINKLNSLLYDNRLTGIAILAGEESFSNANQYPQLKILEIIDFREQQKRSYPPDKIYIDSSDPLHHTIKFNRDSDGTDQYQDNIYNVGDFLEFYFKQSNGDYTKEVGVVKSVTYPAGYIQLVIPSIDFSQYDNCSGAICDAIININKRWHYSGGSYQMNMVYQYGDAGPDFYEYTGRSPEGNHYPNYRRHFVIGGRAFINSKEDGEGDYIRYSALNQYDVFPPDNIIRTETGDFDEILDIAKIGDRFFIMKNNSLSYGSFLGNSFEEHIGFSKIGLLKENAFVIVDNAIFFLSKNDIYIFDGVSLKSITRHSRINKYYNENISQDSFIGYDKIRNELLVFMGDKILVWNPNSSEWYIRETEISPKYAINDYDRRLLIYGDSQSKIYTINHDSNIFDEQIRAYVKTRIIENERQDQYKKIASFSVVGRSGLNQANMNFYDYSNNILAQYQIQPNQTFDETHLYPNFIYKLLQIELEYPKTNSLDIEIEQIILRVKLWK